MSARQMPFRNVLLITSALAGVGETAMGQEPDALYPGWWAAEVFHLTEIHPDQPGLPDFGTTWTAGPTAFSQEWLWRWPSE